MATVRERIAAAKLEDQRLTQTGGRSVRDRIAAAKEQERAFTQRDHVKTVSQVRQAWDGAVTVPPLAFPPPTCRYSSPI